jgi:hypothetical protein
MGLPSLRKTTYGDAALRWIESEDESTERGAMRRSTWFGNKIVLMASQSLIVGLALLMLTWNSWGQAKRPLKAEDIEQLLSGGVTQERIVHLIRDGGVNFETAPKLIAAGVNRLAIGSAIFEEEDIQATIEEFLDIAVGESESVDQN